MGSSLNPTCPHPAPLASTQDHGRLSRKVNPLLVGLPTHGARLGLPHDSAHPLTQGHIVQAASPWVFPSPLGTRARAQQGKEVSTPQHSRLSHCVRHHDPLPMQLLANVPEGDCRRRPKSVSLALTRATREFLATGGHGGGVVKSKLSLPPLAITLSFK